MMLDKIHISIRRALIIFCMVFIASLSAVTLSYAYLDRVSDEEVKVKNSMRIWKNKIGDAKDNNSTIVGYEKLYLRLIENGIVGEENRLSWFETLQSTASSRGLDKFRFSMASQTKIDSRNIDKDYKSIDIYRSVMSLNMEVSHEGDIFSVFNDLDASAKGLYSIDNCDVGRTTIKNSRSGGENSRMKADCELSWYTFKPSQGKR